MDQEQIDLLTQKIADKSISNDELNQYYHWLNSDDGKPLAISVASSKEELQNRIFSSIAEKSGFNAPSKNVRLWPRLVAAASIAIAVMTGSYLYYDSQIVNPNSSIVNQNDIAPGKNGATLTLANGKKIYINDALAGNIADEAGVRITKTKDGQLVYVISSEQSDEKSQSAGTNFNTLTTTRGEQTQVRLPDGTLVFLNAESSLKYPNNFAGSKNRRVTLTGEGFFEVTKDKDHPFIVDTKGQSVEVLGTHFNINAYENSSLVKTTLLEGSVRVSGSLGNFSKLLKPGQQAKVAGNAIDILDVEPADAVAWRNGRVMYDGEVLENIMSDVARWYNVEVVYKNDSVKDKTFFVSVSRKDNVSKLLKLLMKTKAVTFEIKGNQIIVDKKSD